MHTLTPNSILDIKNRLPITIDVYREGGRPVPLYGVPDDRSNTVTILVSESSDLILRSNNFTPIEHLKNILSHVKIKWQQSINHCSVQMSTG